MRLEWQRQNLYMVDDDLRPRHIGVVIRGPFGKRWGVFTNGKRRSEANSEAEARAQLEAYAAEAEERR